jgi:hypothetical protein
VIQKEQTTGKITDCCKRLNNTNPVPYKTLIKQLYFSFYNAAKAMKLIGEEENHRQNLQSLVVQFEDYTTCDIALTVCAVHTMTTCWEHMLNKPE